MEDTQRHLAWLFYAYGIIEIIDWVSLFSLLWLPGTAAAVARGLGITPDILYLKVGALLYIVGFLIINSLYMRNYLLKNPHLAKVPVGVTYSVIAIVGYAWFWVLMGIVYNEPAISFVAGGMHLAFALAIGVVAERLPKHAEPVVVQVRGFNGSLSAPSKKAKKKRK